MTKAIHLLLISSIILVGVSARAQSDSSQVTRGILVTMTELFGDVEFIDSATQINFSITHSRGSEHVVLLPIDAGVYKDSLLLKNGAIVYVLTIKRELYESIFNRRIRIKKVFNYIDSANYRHYVEYGYVEVEILKYQVEGSIDLDYYGDLNRINLRHSAAVKEIKFLPIWRKR